MRDLMRRDLDAAFVHIYGDSETVDGAEVVEFLIARGWTILHSRRAYQTAADDGLTIAETAARLSVTDSAVRQAAARQGLTFKGVGRSTAPLVLAEVRAMARRGLTVPAAARELGVLTNRLYVFARTRDVPFVRGKPGPKPRRAVAE